MSKLIRIEPARCKGKFQESMWDDPEWVAEHKLDGSRYQLYMEEDGSTYLYSRRDFPRIEKGANVPHISHFIQGLHNTILDGEIRHPEGKFLGDTTRLMLMLPDTAVAEQERVGKLTFTVFDIPALRGRDMRQFRYTDRHKILSNVIQAVANPYIQVVQRAVESKKEFYNQIVENGGEGIVLKHIDSPYGEYWVKKKKTTDVSVFIVGFTPGKGKYENTLGALRLGVRDTVGYVEVGKAAGMTDDQRHEFWDNQAQYKYKVIDVRTQEMTRHGLLREPRFLRVREDLSFRECTLTKLREELS